MKNKLVEIIESQLEILDNDDISDPLTQSDLVSLAEYFKKIIEEGDRVE